MDETVGMHGWRYLLNQVLEDLAHHRSDIFSPGWRALVAYRIGNWALGRPTALGARIVVAVSRLGRSRSRRHYGIDIDPRARIGRRVHLAHQSGIAIGPGAKIGDDCLVRHRVRIGSLSPDSEAPDIGASTHIGVGALIIGDVRVGKDARVGPNVVVDFDVPAGSAVLPFTPIHVDS